jgi:hypothetical protein
MEIVIIFMWHHARCKNGQDIDPAHMDSVISHLRHLQKALVKTNGLLQARQISKNIGGLFKDRI